MFKVALVAGHNQGAPGACHNGVCEYPLTKDMMFRVAGILMDVSGIQVLTHAGGSLEDKVAWVNKMAPNLAMEFHYNGCGGCKAEGTETLYDPGSDNGHEAATLIHPFIVEAVGGTDRGIKEGWYHQDKPGRVDYPGDVDGDEHRLYFLHKTACPALILEPEFIEQVKPTDVEFFEHVAYAVAEGIIEYAKFKGFKVG